MSRPERDVEDLLRRAMREHAEDLHPAGDGLTRIQTRVQRRQRSGWLRPGIAVAAVVVAAVGIIAVPTVLHRGGGPDHSVGASPDLTPRPSTATDTTAMHPSDASRRLTVWPYPNAAVAATHVGSDGRLSESPQQLALQFVRTFAGSAAPADLGTDAPRRTGDGLTVGVNRSDLNGREVCRVTLVPVSTGPAGGPAYVIAGATASRLSVDAVSALRGTDTVRLGGHVTEPRDVALRRLWAKVGRPTAPTLDVNTTALPAGEAGWALAVNLTSRLAESGLVAVWTVDSAGRVVDFAAEPAI